MPNEVMQVSTLSTAMLKRMQELEFVLHDHSHILDPAALARAKVLVGKGEFAKVDKKLLQMMPNVKLIAIVGETYAGLDLDVVLAKNIQVTYTPLALGNDVADHALALMLNLGRRVLQADRFVRNSDWVDEPFTFTQRFSGCKVGILGMGPLGRAIAKRVSAFDMPVFYAENQPVSDAPYTYCRTAYELAAVCDYLVLAMQTAPTISPVITTEVLQALGPKGYLVNVSHAKAVDPAVLVAALQSKQIAGAGIDVFWDEPRVPAELRALQNVVLTPHIGNATLEQRTRMEEDAIDNVLAYFEGKPLSNLIEPCR
jgi:lactate dehydrogenase-like 2-hydroxyacid dehydrogenase